MRQNVTFLISCALFLLLPACSSPPPVPDTTPEPDVAPKPPAAPTRLSAQTTDSVITLHWIDESEGETGFIIERQEEGEQFSILAEIPLDSTTYTDNDTETGVKYSYRVRAVNQNEMSAPTNEVSYTPLNLERGDSQDTYPAGNSGSEGRGSFVGISNDLLTHTSANMSLSTSQETDIDLPEGLAMFAPRISVSVASASIDLATDSASPRSELVVIPESIGEPPGGMTFALVRVETQGEPFEFHIPYDPRYPEFPIRIRSEYLHEIDEAHGLTDPIRIHVYPLVEDNTSSNLDVQVRKQELGLFALPDHTDYRALFGDDCENRRDFWSPAPVIEEQDLDGKTPLVLVHGWQTISNLKFGPRIYFPGKTNTPHVCTWLSFLDTYREETDLHEVYELYSYSYDSDKRVEPNAQALVGDLERAFPDMPAVVLGHSMGGLVATTADRKTETQSIGSVLSLGTPYHGSVAASCRRVENGLCDHVTVNPEVRENTELTFKEKVGLPLAFRRDGTKDLAFERGIGEDPCGEFAKEIAENGALHLSCSSSPVLDNPFMVDLNADPPPDADSYFAFAGDISSIKPPSDEELDETYEKIADTVHDRFGYRSDGIVTVESSILGGTSIAPISPLDHTVLSGVHHSDLKGNTSRADDLATDPLSEIMEKLSEIAPVKEPPEELPPEEQCEKLFCISGSIQDWNGDTATIQAQIEEPQDGGLELVAQSPVARDGSFEMVLPHLSDEQLLISETPPNQSRPGCTGGFTLEPDTFQHNSADFSLRGANYSNLYLGYFSDTHQSEVEFVYVDREVVFIGTEVCADEYERNEIKVDIHMTPGWNTVIWNAERNERDEKRGSTLSLRTGSIPSNVSWRQDNRSFARNATSLKTELLPKSLW